MKPVLRSVRPPDLVGKLFTHAEWHASQGGVSQVLLHTLLHLRAFAAATGKAAEVCRFERDLEGLMELTFFYTCDRPWNLYRGDPHLARCIEKVLRAFPRTIRRDGSAWLWFGKESGGDCQDATQAMIVAQSLALLPKDFPGRAVALTALHTRLLWLLTNSRRTYGTPKGDPTTNHFARLPWAAYLCYQMTSDRELKSRLDAFTNWYPRVVQDRAGFITEWGAPASGWAVMNTVQGFGVYYELSHDPRAREVIQRWRRWMTYNLMPYPALKRSTTNRLFYCNVAPAANRTNWPAVGVFGSESARQPDVIADRRTLEQIARRRVRFEFTQGKSWGHAHWIYPFLHPSGRKLEACATTLPVQRPRFGIRFRSQFRFGTFRGSEFLFVRRPRFYAGFAYGDKPNAPMRMGCSFLYLPSMGMVIHPVAANHSPYLGGQIEAFETRLGNVDLAQCDLRVRYRGKPERGSFTIEYLLAESRSYLHGFAPDLESSPKTVFQFDLMRAFKRITISDAGIEVAIQLPGARLCEQIPLSLLDGDRLFVQRERKLTLVKGGYVGRARALQVVRGRHRFRIEFADECRVRILTPRMPGGLTRTALVRLSSDDGSLDYRLLPT